MSTYVIGDIQGCFNAFLGLLQKCAFDPQKDKLWLVGDLVNRGNGSLEVLRWVYAHRDCVTAVLGNHDLHALVVAEGLTKPRRSDTLQALLTASDAPELLRWLRYRPLAHYEGGFLMVHAGVLPAWGVADVIALAGEVEQALQSQDYREFFKHMYGNEPALWQDSLQGWDRLRVITNALTRIRICADSGEMEFQYKGLAANIHAGFRPWFEMPNRRSEDTTIIFGHWSALGLVQRSNLVALDTGCLWGGQLTAMRLDDRSIFQVPSHAEDGAMQAGFAD